MHDTSYESKKRTRNNWKEEDIHQLDKYLEENLSYEEIAQRMNRSLNSVKVKAQRRKIELYGKKREPNKIWNKEEFARLEILINENKTLDEIAKELGRTKNAIRVKVSRLNLQVRSSGRVYTEKELSELYEDWKYSNKSMDALSKKYKRGKEAITIIAQRKGFGPRLSDSEFLTIRDLSEHIGISKDTVRTWMRNGLKYKKCHAGRTRYMFHLEDVHRFLMEHQELFSAEKVSDTLFLDEPDWLKEKRIKDKTQYAVKNHEEYSNEDDLVIISMRKKGHSLEEIAQKLRRTRSGIQSRMMTIFAGKLHPTYWSEEELTILRENSDYMTIQELSHLLNNKRSVRSIEWKCEKLGLKYHIKKERCKKRDK